MSQPSHSWNDPPGQATFEMANLRPKTTGLPFVVFISQRGNARHDVRVRVSPGPRVQIDAMGTYAVRPFRYEYGTTLNAADEKMLERWVSANLTVLVDYWNADLEYTEDAIEKLVKI